MVYTNYQVEKIISWLLWLQGSFAKVQQILIESLGVSKTQVFVTQGRFNVGCYLVLL